MSVKIGIVSYGKVARLQAKAITGLSGVELAGVYGRDPVKAKAFAGDFGICVYDSIAEMGKAGVDIAIIRMGNTGQGIVRRHRTE